MQCKYCGQEMKSDAQFCANCGANNADNTSLSSGTTVSDSSFPVNDFNGKKKSKGKLFTTLAVILLIVIVAVVRLSNLDAYRVKGGHPNLYPNTTWEDALKDVCKKSKWKSYKEDGDKLEIIFKVKGDEFSVESIEKDGDDVSIISAVRDIFSGDL